MPFLPRLRPAAVLPSGPVRRGAAALAALALALALPLGGCGTVAALGQLEDGAGAEAGRVWDRWTESGGDIAVAATWARKVEPGVTVAQIEQALASVASDMNIRPVGEPSLAGEGPRQPVLKVYAYCNPTIARRMIAFSPHMAAFMPCRITLVEREDGLWLYTLNMDMMIRMGRRLPPDLKADALQVRDAIWQMMDKGARGDF